MQFRDNKVANIAAYRKIPKWKRLRACTEYAAHANKVNGYSNECEAGVQ